MDFNIESTSDIYKFALPLYDYLNQSGQAELAQSLGDKADGCYSSAYEALAAHRKAFTEVRLNAPDLPQEYAKALDTALDILDDF